MKLTQLFLCMFFIFTGCMADFESATERLYAAYKAKNSEEKERVFKKSQLEIGNKKEQLKPLIKFAMQVGDFEVLKQAIKDREKEKPPFYCALSTTGNCRIISWRYTCYVGGLACF